ncbi:DNA repair protein XRCC2 [Porphyridium purpureum]|uniref:DNA repair protein XRCC2 n=1 Tax=Porphyridium purpureum TaxID=35688 RepID=A0A5J4YIB5_PORPP|nr:DNA repair protein XRCC2 [Porphyridium purpureum]|eukprot:POR0057..scf297_16
MNCSMEKAQRAEICTGVPVLDTSSDEAGRRRIERKAWGSQSDGLRFGDVLQIHGMSGAGKGMLMLHLLAQCLLPEALGGNGLHVVFIYCVARPNMRALVRMLWTRAHVQQPQTDEQVSRAAACAVDDARLLRMLAGTGQTEHSSEDRSIALVRECISRLAFRRARSMDELIFTLHALHTDAGAVGRTRDAGRAVLVEDFTLWMHACGDSTVRFPDSLAHKFDLQAHLAHPFWTSTEPVDLNWVARKRAAPTNSTFETVLMSVVLNLVRAQKLVFILSSASADRQTQMYTQSEFHGMQAGLPKAAARADVQEQTEAQAQVPLSFDAPGEMHRSPAALLNLFTASRTRNAMPTGWKNLVSHNLHCFRSSQGNTFFVALAASGATSLESWRPVLPPVGINEALLFDGLMHFRACSISAI